MKGSVVVLLGCFAFFAAPSHSYSVEFISENDQVANRRDTQSGSPSTGVATTGDAVQNSDTSAGESETIKMGGDTKPGDEPVPGDAQTGKSNIRKRDTRSFVRNMMDSKDDVTTLEVTKQNALSLLRHLQYHGNKCLKEIFKYLEEHEIFSNSPGPRGPQIKFTRSGMIKWLHIIRGTMSKCIKEAIERFVNGSLPSHDDDDTRDPRLMPLPVYHPFYLSELVLWFRHIGQSLEKGFINAIRVLEAVSENPANTVRRSSNTISDFLEELMHILLKFDGGAFPNGVPPPFYPPGQAYPDAVPVITAFKKSNFLDKARGDGYYANLPAILSERAPLRYTKEIPILPQASGFRDEAEQTAYTPGITTLPEDVTALPNPQLSLLQKVLGQIFSRLQGGVSLAGNTQTPSAESLRDDANGVSGFYPGFGSGESPAAGFPGNMDPDLLQCLEDL